MSVILSEYTNELEARANKEDFFFIQVGVHCAGTVIAERGEWSPHCIDPIHRYVKQYDWSGILIEPQEGPFEMMKEFYKDQQENLQFLQCAVSDKSGSAPFYISERDELSSLTLEKGEQDRVVLDTIHVPCMTLNEIVVKHAVTHIDLLQIDVEGFDCLILLSYDFTLVHPSVISFEHRHCTADEYQACEAILKREGYRCMGKGDFDALFVIKNQT